MEEEIDIGKYVGLLLKRWPWFIAALAICMPAAYLVNHYSKDSFFTNATILIRDQTQYETGVDKIIQQMAGVKSQNMKNLITEVGIIKSKHLSRKTVHKLDLRISYYKKGLIHDVEKYKDAPFAIVLDPTRNQKEGVPVNITLVNDNQFEIGLENNGVKTRKRLRFNSWFVNKDFAFKVEKTRYFTKQMKDRKYHFCINNLERVTSMFHMNLAAELSDEDGSIITIGVKGDMVRKNIDFLNQLAVEYISEELEEKNAIAKNAIDFIDKQLTRIDDSLQQAEGNLQLYRQNNKIIDLGKEGSALFDKLETQQTQLSLLEVKMKYYDYLQKYIEKKTDFKDVITPSIMGINDQLLNKLVSDLSILNQEKKVLEYSVKTNNPQVDILDVRIKNTMESLVEVVTNIVQGAKIEKSALISKIALINADIQKLPSTERGMVSIKRKYDLNDNIYNFLQQKRAEAGIASASNTSDSKVLEWATESNTYPMTNKKKLMYILAFVIALLIPSGTIIGLHFFDNTVRTIREVESSSGLAVLGMIPRNEHDAELVVHGKPRSFIAESFRALKTQVIKGTREARGRVIAVSSTVNGEGKTFCAMNLASSFAMSNKRVLLVDCDLWKPRVHERFGLPNDSGLGSCLEGKDNLAGVVKNSHIKNLDLVTAGPASPGVGDLMGSEALVTFVARARETYEVVILDTPPVALASDAMLLMPLADTSIYVIRENISKKNTMKIIRELAANTDIKNLVVCVNDVRQLSEFKQGVLKRGSGNGYYEL